MFADQASPTDQIPDINKLTEGLSPTQTVVVVIAVAVIVLAVFVFPRVWPERKPPAAPQPPTQLPASSPATGVQMVPPPEGNGQGGVVTDEVRASRALLDRLVSGLEQQLADELARTERIESRYDLIVQELRKQLAAVQEENWQMRDQIAELRRQITGLKGELETSHQNVVDLRAQLRVYDGQRFGEDPRRHGGGRW